MKVVQIGSGSDETYQDLKLNKSNAKNYFGDVYYFSDTIFLAQSNGVTDYQVGRSKLTQKMQISFNSPQLLTELKLITDSITARNPDLKFKPHEGERFYIKLANDCAKISPNCNLQYCIKLYGCFYQKASSTTYLQMEVSEALSEKISILTPQINYVP